VIVAENLDEAGIRAIEERAFNAWPALRTVIAQGWIFRFSEGFTRRANSVNALAPVGPFEDTLRMAEALYAKQGLPVVFHLSPLAGSDVDGVLERAGYRRVDEGAVLFGLAVVARGMVGLFDIVTAPDARRRGASRRVVGSLLAWGHSRGVAGRMCRWLRTTSRRWGCMADSGFGRRTGMLTG
jgi:GNAT superfamily N-acetyltransferase